MKLNCTAFRQPNEWQIPKSFQDSIKDWIGEGQYPFYKHTMADIWWFCALVGFKHRRRGAVEGPVVKSVPANVFSEEQALSLRLAAAKLLDDEYQTFMDDKAIHDTLYPYMVGGLEILAALFKDNAPTYYQQKLADLTLNPA